MQTQSNAYRLRRSFLLALSLVALLWAIKLIESTSSMEFARFGILPRHASGLPGILFAPFVHGSFSHLLANTSPIVLIGTLLLYGYPRATRVLLPTVWLGGGAAVWLFAREAHHVGASGLVFGMLFFVLMAGVLRWEPRAIAIALVVFFLYGSSIWGVLPAAPDVSFESHLSGAVIGIALAFKLKDLDPGPPRRKYSWEGEEDEEDDGYDWPNR